MRAAFTAVSKTVGEGYVAFVEELPGANTQGKTLGEARANLEEAGVGPRGESDPGRRGIAGI